MNRKGLYESRSGGNFNMSLGDSFDLHVRGKKLSVRAEGDSEVVSDAVQVAQTKIDDAQKRLGERAPLQQVALLAILDLAEDYARAKKRTVEYRKRVDDKASSLLEYFESNSTEGPPV